MSTEMNNNTKVSRCAREGVMKRGSTLTTGSPSVFEVILIWDGKQNRKFDELSTARWRLFRELRHGLAQRRVV